MMKEKCSVCYKRFDAVMAKEMLNDDLEEIFFRCPRCGERYHLAYTNKEARQCENDIQDALKNNQPDRVHSMMKRHLDLMNNLNGK